MPPASNTFRRVFRLPWRTAAHVTRDIEDEIAFHLEARVQELLARGLSPDAARTEAMRRFGDIDSARRYCRDVGRRRHRTIALHEWLESWGQDLRYAVRQLGRNPGFALIAVLTLGLGIGANTAIFSVVRRLLIQPLPYAGGDRIVSLMRAAPGNQMLITPSPKLVNAWQVRARTLEGVSPYDTREVTLTGECANRECDAELMEAGLIEPSLPRFLGVRPVLGRSFVAEEASVGASSVVLIGYGLWQRRFGGDRDILGRTVMLDGKIHTIAGVMPRDFDLPDFDGGKLRQLWLPFVAMPDAERWQAIARIRRDVDIAQVNTELTAIMASMAEKEKFFTDWSARAMRPQDYLGSEVRDALLTLMAAVGVVLLIACANIANLLLARATTRQRELAVRAALGAGRFRLMRQLLTESVCLGVVGGALGVALAWLGLDVIVAMRPDSLSELDSVRLEPIALALTLGISLATGLLFGLAPALLATEHTAGETLKDFSRTLAGRQGSRRFRSAMVIGQVALSVVLLVAAGLLVRSVRGLQRVEVGFVTRNLHTMQIILPEERYKSVEQRAQALGELLAGARSIPGVTAATVAIGAPPRSGITFGELEIEGQPLPAIEEQRAFGFDMVQPHYFTLLGQQLREGRPFDSDTSQQPVIISLSMAAKYWPTGSAIGHRLRIGGRGLAEWRTVIGVAADIRVPGARGTHAEEKVYFPFSPVDGGTFILRTTGPTPSLLAELTQLATRMDAGIRVRDPATAESTIAQSIAGPRFTMALLGTFAGLALVISAVGLYGVVAYTVAQRTREIGVRMALGAAPGDVLRMVVSKSVRLAVAGILVGLLLAAAATRTMQSLLFNVGALDPLTFIGVGVLLGAVALLASYVPARAASRVDPLTALRVE
ncbi:MAG: ABC transporter permease [Anaerolineae bacterium]|nr:ABC transporter permease [Gemmatimonadaceae bacterium]